MPHPTNESEDSYGTMTDSSAGNGSANGGRPPLASETARIANAAKDDTRANDITRRQSQTRDANQRNSNFVAIETAIEKVGTGAFQFKILLATGLCFMADAMEVLLLTFLSTVLKHEWNLSESEVDSIVAVVFAGALLGTLVLGKAGDYRGRKPVFAFTASLIAIAGVATAFCKNYQDLLVARFWVGFGVGGLTVPFDTLAEFLPGAARGKNLLYIEFFWTFGTLSVPALAYLTLDTAAAANVNGESHWQLFVILCSIPCFLSALLGLVLVPESPRWLLEQSHGEKLFDNANRRTALEILQSAARSNGVSQAKIEKELFPPNTILVLSMQEVENQLADVNTANIDPVYEKAETNNEKMFGSFSELFRTPDQIRVTLFLWATWFGFGFLYYGVIIAVSLVFTSEEEKSAYGGNDDYVDYDDGESVASYGFDFGAIFVTASAEIFGLIAVLGTIDSMGRIPSQTIAYRVGGISTFLLGLVCIFWSENSSSDVFRRCFLIALAFVSRMAMMASSCVTWVSTSEMLSTEIRSTGHGAANAMARLGGFIAPFVITEGNSMATIGILVLLVSILTAECASKLPETAGKPMGAVTGGASEQKEDTILAELSVRSEPTNSYQQLL